MHPLLVTTLLLALLGGCATDSPEYRVGAATARQPKEQAEQTHAKQTEVGVGGGQLDAPLKAISTPFPDYPPGFRNANITGNVRIRFIVEANGSVSNPSVQGSPPPALAAITLHAIMRWRFEPPRRAGVATRVAAEQEFVFNVE